MEINHLSPQAVAPIRAASAVDDGDAGPNSPYYRRRKQQQRHTPEESAEDQTPRLEGSGSHIDIRV